VPVRVSEPVEAGERVVAPAGAAEEAACLEADGRHTCCRARLWAGRTSRMGAADIPAGREPVRERPEVFLYSFAAAVPPGWSHAKRIGDLQEPADLVWPRISGQQKRPGVWRLPL
jgi:hypothetical protein